MAQSLRIDHPKGMDPHRHATLSASRHGGDPEDYWPLHHLMDATKELCSDNRHRLLHNLWGIRQVVIPLVGPVIEAAGRTVRTKTVLEHDHVQADFGGRFIPTLTDFVDAIAPEGDESKRFVGIQAPYRDDDEAMRLLLSPYFVTGRIRALLVTHNTWFLGELLPRLCRRPPRLVPPGVPPDELFARMKFEAWMDNGATLPKSAPRRSAFTPLSKEAPCRS
ncbi:MAG: hypothetical protein AAGA48_15085 [Myxococcota bacterium]